MYYVPWMGTILAFISMDHVPWFTKTDCGMVLEKVINERTKKRYGWCLWGMRRRRSGNKDFSCCNRRIRLQLVPGDIETGVFRNPNRKRFAISLQSLGRLMRRYARWGRRSCNPGEPCPYDRRFQCHCVYCTLISLTLSPLLARSISRPLTRSLAFTHTRSWHTYRRNSIHLSFSEASRAKNAFSYA